MDFKVQLIDSSRKVIDLVTENVGNNPEYFKSVLDIALQDIPQISARAARVICFVTEKYPDLFQPYAGRVIRTIPGLKFSGIQHSLLRLFVSGLFLNNEDDIGILADYCFTAAQSINSTVAVRVYCIEILYQITLLEPDLKNELISVIEEQLPYGSAGFKSRGKKLLEKLYKEIL